MKRIALLIASLCLCGLTPIYVSHDEQKKTDDEFIGLYDGVQSRQFRIVTTTPNLTDFRDGEMMVFTSTNQAKVMMRVGNEIYLVNFSCITVRR